MAFFTPKQKPAALAMVIFLGMGLVLGKRGGYLIGPPLGLARPQGSILTGRLSAWITEVRCAVAP
jgi:hypothetical protein